MAESYASSYQSRGKSQPLYDAAGNPVDMDALTAAQNMPLSEGEMLLAKRAHRNEMAANLALGALAGGAQIGMAYVPTAQDRENKAKLGDLERRRAAGRLGQNAQEDAFIEASSMNPVRALATQQAQRGESERASVGASQSARQALESERIGRQQVTEAAGKVGLQKAQRFLERKAGEEQELQQRLAYESEKQKNRLSMIGQTISGLAGLGGKYAAGMVQETITPDQLDEFLQKYPENSGKSTREILGNYRKWKASSTRGDLSKRERALAAADVSGDAANTRAGQ
jgi:hypothetical protein